MTHVRESGTTAVRPPWRRGRALVLLVALTTAISTAVAAPAGAVNVPHDAVVSDDPANFTPHVEDGAVKAITKVGDTMFAAGNFTTVRNQGSTATLTRRSIFAFDATTGDIITSFAPTFDGDINSLDTDGTFVYAGGGFNTVNGQTRRKVVKLTTSGALASGQPPAVNSYVNEVVVRGDRLYLGGLFSRMGGQDRAAFAAVDKDTGALLDDVNVPFTGLYNGGTTNIKRFDVTADGRTMVAVGNFTAVGGEPREQVAKVNLPATGPAVVDAWATDRYSQARNNCANVFDTFVRDVDFSPQGEYFVVTTTGAFAGGANSGTLCDANVRWETAPSSSGQQPTWVSYTGGDTSYGVAVTGTAVYVGGHMRWVNNPYQGDQAGPGAVPRDGIVALDPVNGLPFSWNPGRTRGVGAQALFSTPQGLWVGSDTDRFAGELRSRIAFLPLAGGTTPPTVDAATLPNHLYQVQRSGQSARVLYRVNAGGPVQLSQDDGPDWAADTAASSTLRNSGSSTATSTISSVDGTVPAGTPRDLFTTERWDSSSAPEMQWAFPVQAGRQVQVRLYLANTCNCTSATGSRVFDVSIDGSVVLDDLDLSGTVGHKVGTMRDFTITSDGTVNIDFGHVVENPLVNAIEILDPTVDATPSEAPLTRRPVDADGAPTGPVAQVSSSQEWAGARAAFLVGDTLYYGTSTGLFARTFDEGTAGAVREVELYDDPDDGGRIPFPTGSLTGAFYDTDLHRIYYTVAGDSRLFYRGFTPESEVVGAQTLVGDNGGIDLSSVAGMTLADGRVFFGSSADGSLRSAPFTAGRVSGGASVVSSDGSWDARGMFVDGPVPTGANESPTARITSTCADLTCTFDGGGSTDIDGTIASHAWEFGDGETATGSSVEHTFATAGDKTVTLTVTDDQGATGTATETVTATAPPQNAEPTASFTQECTELTCSFDATASDDADGTVESYAWDFGDGETGTGVTVDHTYATAGDKEVTLTVTDNRGATASTTATASPTETTTPPPAADVTFRGAGEGTGNARSAAVTLPVGIEAGDQILLFVSANRSATVGAPAGAGDFGAPVQEGSGGRDQMRTWVWAKTADGDEGGRAVTVGFDSFTKFTASAAVYGGAVLDSSALASETVDRPEHTTPEVTVDDAGSWVLSYWADKTSATTDWTSPTGVTDRSEVFAPGAGRVTSLLTDSGGPVATGQRGGLTATADSSTVKAVTASVVLRPATADPGTEPNTAPTAAFAWTCSDLACAFDAADSTDPDGTVTGYAWDFGDGGAGTGVAPDHTYATPGDYTVTLTVTDNRGATGSAATPITVTAAPPAEGDVVFGATAASTSNTPSADVRLPIGVEAGDQLLVFMSTNRTVTAADPTGWTRLQRQSGDRDQIQGWLWSRTATAADAGASLAVEFDRRAKYVLTVAAYRGAQVDSSVAVSETVDRPDHTTPTALAGTDGSWVLSYWTDKTSATTDWVSPTGTTDRAEVVAAGAGRVTSLLVDSDGPVAPGQVGGRTATADSSSQKALMLTVVLRPV